MCGLKMKMDEYNEEETSDSDAIILFRGERR